MLPAKNKFLVEIKEKLKCIHHTMTNIEKIRFLTESSLNLFEECENNLNNNSVDKISKHIYLRNMLKSSKNEEYLLRDALNTIKKIKDIKTQQKLEVRKAGIKDTIRCGVLMKTLLDTAKSLPLFVGKWPNCKLPPLCGCIPAKANYIAQHYDMVAALVENEKIGETWILAEVESFNKLEQTYVVEDIDAEDKASYTVLRHNVVPLPEMRANPLTDDKALFTNGAKVLAVYPQTTCFYQGIIYSQPETCADDYLVLFDEELTPIFVPQRYVIAYPKNKIPSKKKIPPREYPLSFIL